MWTGELQQIWMDFWQSDLSDKYKRVASHFFSDVSPVPTGLHPRKRKCPLKKKRAISGNESSSNFQPPFYQGTFVRFRGSVFRFTCCSASCAKYGKASAVDARKGRATAAAEMKPKATWESGAIWSTFYLLKRPLRFDFIFCGLSFFAWFDFQFHIFFSGWWITYRRWFYLVPYVLFSYCWWWKDPYRWPEVLEKNRLSSSNKLAGKKGMKFDFSILHVFNFGRVISPWKWRKHGHNKPPTKKVVVVILGKIYKHQVVNCQLFQQNPLTELPWCMQIGWQQSGRPNSQFGNNLLKNAQWLCWKSQENSWNSFGDAFVDSSLQGALAEWHTVIPAKHALWKATNFEWDTVTWPLVFRINQIYVVHQMHFVISNLRDVNPKSIVRFFYIFYPPLLEAFFNNPKNESCP